MIEEAFQNAADDIREALAKKPVPDFESKAANKHRVALVAATVLLFTLGIAFFATQQKNNEEHQQFAAETQKTLPSANVPLQGNTSVDPLPASLMNRPGDKQITEPNFQTNIQSLTNAAPEQSLLPLQIRPAWNSDGSYLLLYQTGGDDSGHTLYEMTSGTTRPLPITPVDIEQVYWDPTQATVLYYVEDNALIRFDVSTEEKKVLHRFSNCDAVSGVGSIRLSTDRTIGQVCLNDQGNTLITYNIKTGEELRTETTSDEAPQPTPESNRFIVRDANNVVSVLNEKLEPTGVTFAIGNDAYAVLETNKGDVLATVMFSSDDLIGSLVTFNLDTGEPTVIVGEATGYPYPPPGTHITTSVANNSFVAFATATAPTEDVPVGDTPVALEGEIILVDLNVQDNETQEIPAHRLAHHRSTGENTKSVWAAVHPAIHPDGTAIAFASDWGQDRVDTFFLTAN